MALDATPGSATANSYSTVVEFKAYWTGRPQGAAALALTDPQIEASLEWATILEDASYNWTGSPVDDVQALNWPRNGMLTKNGFVIGPTVIPVQLKNSVNQLAGDLAAADRAADNDALKQGITGITAGPVSLQFANIKQLATLEEMDAALRRMGPDFAYLADAISDASRILLVPSWYVRANLLRPVIFEVSR